ncbi:uncharacterized protein LOC110030939 [Phalaenopsis equestris]|uniref:uncharacterized protein LOC110030939 n=1 Tax=Phalaenopsis equestris TaxID=78828 RepID=UPI0009E4BF2A|nr:uncharacterized protein LOC110030939 [Phalaenopsis equestris]
MMLDRIHLLLPVTLIFLLRLIAVHTSDSPPEKPASAYEVLRRHGLPIGLFPKGVQDFRIGSDGRFEAHLPEECTVTFETAVHYQRNVTGMLSYGQIAGISGVTAQELFLWFPVRVIRVDIPSTGLIYFDVGVIYKQFSLSLFETPPDCRPASHDRLIERVKSVRIRVDRDEEDGGRATV